MIKEDKIPVFFNEWIEWMNRRAGKRGWMTGNDERDTNIEREAVSERDGKKEGEELCVREEDRLDSHLDY